MGYRWRRMYYLTGLPGWMRFGYSPGWIGRSPSGLPPMAEWLISSGLLPQFQQYIASRGASITPFTPPGAPLTKEQEVQMLEEQAKAIETQLEEIRRRLDELKKSPSGGGYDQAYYPNQPYFPPTLAPYPLYTQPSPEEELASLEDYKKHLEDEVKGVEARIEELKKNLGKEEK